LTFPIAGFGFDTTLAWAANKNKFIGAWPVVRHHLLDTPGTKRFVAHFRAQYRRLPENQAWGHYVALKIIAQSRTKSGRQTRQN
jgi:branched-chain amino acid transport system substrate-binding protein